MIIINVTPDITDVDINVTPDVTDAIIQVSPIGLTGLSAYQVALQNGFVGNEQDWLDSLKGANGVGVPTGGTTGQVLAKIDNTDYNTEWVNVGSGGGAVDSVNGQTGIVVLGAADVGAYPDTNPSNFIAASGAPVQSVAGKTGVVTLAKADVGLSNVDNTSDLSKPISTATQTALDGKANTVHTHVAANITDFNTAVSANSDVTANTAARHSAVTLSGTPNYLTLAGQVITRALIDLSSHVTGKLPFANLANGTEHSVIGRAGSGSGDVGNISAGNDTILARSGSGNVDFQSASTIRNIINVENGAQVNTVTSVASKTGAVTLVKADVGLSNVDNTSDLSKPISTATQTALDGKQATLVSGTNIKTINGDSILGSGDLVVSGGGGLTARQVQSLISIRI